MRDLIDVHDPHAPLIRVVLDNLLTHRIASLYQALSPSEARRIARRLELHDPPKHASWLNMVEIEIGMLQRQCRDRRIEDRMTLKREDTGPKAQGSHSAFNGPISIWRRARKTR